MKLSLMDSWIMSCLATAVSACNAGFHQYDFPRITTAIHHFFLYELCDVYLVCQLIKKFLDFCKSAMFILFIVVIYFFQESIKPVFQADDESAKAAARSVLLTCLDTAFKLISPFMPFLSEELWQRLPRPAAWQSK